MANEMYKAFMVGSQLMQIGQQMRTNQQLNALQAHQLSQVQAQERLAWIQEQVFIIRQNLDSAATSLDSNPARAYYLSEINIQFLNREGISTRSFHDLRDKEYFNQIWQYAQEIRAHAVSVLPEELIASADEAIIGQAILPQLRALTAWTEIAELLPGGLLKKHYRNWQIPIQRMSLIIGCLFFTIPTLCFPIPLGLLLYIWLTDPYPKILPRIRELAQSVGGWVSDHIMRKDALQIASQHRSVLENWGFNPPAKANELKECVRDIEEIVNNFSSGYLQLE